MNELEDQVKKFVLEQLKILNHGKKGLPEEADERFNFIASGTIDSLGFLDLIGAVENEFGFEYDFSELDIEEFTTLKSFVSHAIISLKKKGTNNS